MREPNWDEMRAELSALKIKELKATAKSAGVTSAGKRENVIDYIIRARKAHYDHREGR